MAGIGESGHVLVTAYDQQGESTASVERVVELADHRLAYWLADGTGVVERFGVAPVVSVRACTRSGRPLLEEPLLEGRASVLTEGPVFEEARAAIREKYGLGTGLAAAADRVREVFEGRTPEAVVVIDIIA